jgi:hypothetical protein
MEHRVNSDRGKAADLMTARTAGLAGQGRVGPSPNPSYVREDVMAAKGNWSDLSEGTRRLIIATAVAEGILKVAALIDLKRRPASEIRGPKWLWAPVIVVLNSAGVAPISYFVFGRRQQRA